MSSLPRWTLSLWIVRHGQSVGNRDRFFTGHGPFTLTDLGRRQAEITARTLCAIAPTAIYTSDLPRAVDTALPLARQTGLPLRERASLRERNLGDITGMTFQEVAVHRPEVWDALARRDPTYRPPGGESHVDTSLRAATFLSELFASHTEGRIVVVSHGIAINHLLMQLLGNPPGTVAPYSFRLDNCSVQRLDCAEAAGGMLVLAINDTSHLAELDESATRPPEGEG